MIVGIGSLLAIIGGIFIQFAITSSRPNDSIAWLSKEWWNAQILVSIGLILFTLGVLAVK